MYEYFEGIVTVITPSYIVVDVNGVGYKVYSPTPFAYQKGDKAKIFIEQVVRDTGITLYGFQSEDDKELFLKLLSVSGIGPKSALAIMQGEVKYLTRFPGVGKKTASQIVLDLKGKLRDYVARLDRQDEEQGNIPPALNDALLALIALGYTQKELDRITPKLEEVNADTADQYIKKGLALLLKK